MRHGIIDASALSLRIKVVTSAVTTVTKTDFCFVADTSNSSNSISFELPPASEKKGRILVFKRTSGPSGRKLILLPASANTIDSQQTFSVGTNYFSVTIISDGVTGWHII